MTPTNEAGHGLPELPVPWSDYWASKGNWALSHNYAAFELADEWLKANLDALALSRGVPDGLSEVTRQLIERDQRGRQKYGATLDRADLSLNDWLQHMAEELMDAAGYALAAKRTAPAAAGAQGEVGSASERATDPGMANPYHVEPTPEICAATLRWAASILYMWEGEPNETGYMGDFKDAEQILHLLADHAAITPQPAAADGGVRERARELLAKAERGPQNDYGTVHRRIAHAAIAEALSSHRQAGEPLAWCALTTGGSIAYFDGRPMLMVGPVGNEHHTVPLYTAPPPGADLSKFRELVERWRDLENGDDVSIGESIAYSECADELLALVEKGAGS